MEPVLADVTAYHPPVVVWPPTQTVRAVVGLVIRTALILIIAAAALFGIPRSPGLGPGAAFGFPGLLRGSGTLLLGRGLHLGGFWRR